MADPLAAHSGATVRDSHPLPFSLAVADEHLGPFYKYHTACGGSNFNDGEAGRALPADGVELGVPWRIAWKLMGACYR